MPEPFFVPGCKHISFCCKVRNFNLGSYSTFPGSLPLKKAPNQGRPCLDSKIWQDLANSGWCGDKWQLPPKQIRTFRSPFVIFFVVQAGIKPPKGHGKNSFRNTFALPCNIYFALYCIHFCVALQYFRVPSQHILHYIITFLETGAEDRTWAEAPHEKWKCKKWLRGNANHIARLQKSSRWPKNE